jgi:hypothetical protein
MGGRTDDTVRFHFDPGLNPGQALGNPGSGPGIGPAPGSTKPVARDRSFEVFGGVSYPTSTRGPQGATPPPAPTPPSPALPTSSYHSRTVPQSRPSPRKARRSTLCHITARIPQRLLEKIDEAAIENNLGRSDVIRSVLSRANYSKKPKSR